MNGSHKRSRKYNGFAEWRDNFLAHFTTDYPKFDLEIIHIVAENDRVHVI